MRQRLESDCFWVRYIGKIRFRLRRFCVWRSSGGCFYECRVEKRKFYGGSLDSDAVFDVDYFRDAVPGAVLA